MDNILFYFVDTDDKGRKLVRIEANLFANNVRMDTCYTVAEPQYLTLTVREARELCISRLVEDFTKSFKNLTREQAEELSEAYSGKELKVNCVTEDTPCGNYWCNNFN